MIFDRVCVISLARRKDRLDAFMSRVPADFPFGPIEPVEAIDGKLVKHPAWWRQGGGAWGCYKSHMRIIEDSLQNGPQRVMIFEDDAEFCDGFARKAIEYLDSLPCDWLQAYLGGQHLKRPIELAGSDLVMRAQNINRTHAYAINGRAGLLALYRHLTDTSDWKAGHHVDHHYGRLHKSSATGFYTPTEWLCGQSAGQSDVSCKSVPERWWTRSRSPEKPAPTSRGQCFVAVVGLHRSGSSAIAMMLHKLGVSMGDKLAGYESVHGGGGEAVGLANVCEWAARFPQPGISVPRNKLRDRLSAWIRRRLRKGGIAGGKYPHLCAMGDELMGICGENLRVIVCDRPLDESIDSLKRRSAKSRGWLAASDDQCESVQRWLWGERERFLAAMPAKSVHTIHYNELIENTEEIVDSAVSFLGIEPTDDQRAAAISHIIRKEVTA